MPYRIDIDMLIDIAVLLSGVIERIRPGITKKKGKTA